MESTKTIYDIAKEAGVSASTVSRVVNNKPGIHEKTRKKVQALLEKYNYSPNEAAYVIEQELTRRGYTCITLSTGPDPERKAECIRILEQRRAEGAVLMGSMFGTESVEESIREHLPHVPIAMANGWLDLPNVYAVLADEAHGVEQCVELLAKQGRRRLAFVEDLDTPSNSSKKQGFQTAMLQLMTVCRSIRKGK